MSVREAREALVREHMESENRLWLKGTHDGPLRGIPPTGKDFTCRCAAFFLFEGERLVCERVYFDVATILGQLGLTGGVPEA